MKKPIMTLLLCLSVTSTSMAIPNPSAVYCVECGYDIQVRTDNEGNQYGVCIFPDGSECNAWAFYNKCYMGEASAECHWPCQELPCKGPGESILVGECCEGLTHIQPAYTYGPDCNDLSIIGWVFLCSDCGNGICENWESRCNCPEDCGQPRIIYVDDDAVGANDGTSWQNAYNFLQDALGDARSSDTVVEIRVAQGTYKPDQGENLTPGDREATFQLLNGVTLKGGYAGYSEPDPNSGNTGAFETNLSGDLNGNDANLPDAKSLLDHITRADNSYHVLTTCDLEPNTALDGFIISGGNANGQENQHMRGGGIYSHSTHLKIVNCTFYCNTSAEHGGAIHNYYPGELIITNCKFTRNASQWGGAIYNSLSNPTLKHCTFTENYSTSTGGAVHNGQGDPLLVNCIFKYNSSLRGGGMYSFCHSNPTLIDCTFISNSAEHFGGGIYNKSGTRQLFIRCIFKNNYAVWYGGGLYNTFSSTPFIQSCLFANNLSNHWGGAIHFFDSNAQVSNCTIVNNSAAKGAAVACGRPDGYEPSNVKIANCILWRNGDELWNNDNSAITITYSCTQGLSGGRFEMLGGNINQDPCFAQPGHWDANGVWIDGDYHLKSQAGRWDPNGQSWVKDDITSPCIDAGDPMSPIGYESFPNGGRINMGAYGSTAEASKSYFGEPICETIVAGDINGDCKVNLEDFAIMSIHWLQDYGL